LNMNNNKKGRYLQGTSRAIRFQGRLCRQRRSACCRTSLWWGRGGCALLRGWIQAVSKGCAC
jgi:hypothetical protein